MSRPVKWFIGVAVILLLGGAALGCASPLILVFQLLFGWIVFLGRVVPQASVPPGSVAVGLASLAIAGLLGHRLARWLWREMRPDAPPWRLRSTAIGVGVVLLMFACGMAATGAAHQVGWLMRDEGPMWVMQHPARRRYICGIELRQIFYAFADYANDHDGKLPDSLEALASVDERVTLRCPSQTGMPYVYYGRGQTWPLDADVPVVAEPLANHEGDGMNVLFGDGSVRWIDDFQVADVIAKRP